MEFYEWLTKKFLDWQQNLGEIKTVTEFAEHIGTSQQNVSSWMKKNGKIPKNPESISKLAKVFGVEVYKILGYEVPKEKHPLNYAPKSLRDKFDSAIEETNQRLLDEFKDGDFFSDEDALQVIRETFAEYGFSYDGSEETNT